MATSYVQNLVSAFSNIYNGVTSGVLNHSKNLIPGRDFIFVALAMGAAAYKTTSSKGKILLGAASLGSLTLGALSIVNFLSQANCLGKEMQDMYEKYGCFTTKRFDDNVVYEIPPTNVSSRGWVYSNCKN